MVRKWVGKTAIFLAILISGGLLSCQKAAEAKKFRIGFAQCCNDAWRDVMNGEMRRELALRPELNFEMQVCEGQNEVQIKQIREMVAAGIDLLLVSPNESKALTPVIEEVYKAGIPVILLDRKTESEQYTAYVGADNYEIGVTAADYLASQIGGRGNIIELQMSMAISPAVGRHRGFRDGLKKYPGLHLVDSLHVPGDMNVLIEALPGLLRKHPGANVIFGHTDLLAETAHKMLEQEGKAKQMFFIGIDGIPGTGRGIQAVEDGILDASLLYPTGGGEAIQLALAVLNKLPFEKHTKLETTVIHPGNARILHNQMKKVGSLQASIDEQVKSLKNLEIKGANQRLYILILLSTLLLAVVLGAFLGKNLRAKQAAFRSLEAKNEEILAHEKQILEMSDEVRAATQAKVDFFTNISHEFRTPLTLILGFAEDLLPSKKLSNDVQQSIGHIRQNAYRLLRLVNQLMDFRKIESAGMKLRASQNDLVAFTKNIMESYGKQAKRRSIDFLLITRQDQMSVWFDPGIMDKVLFNLLSNAFKFTPDGGKIQLCISVDNAGNDVLLTVEDSGKGMSKEELEHVFEAFYQGEERQMTGTGLGLSLSRSLVELHGGSLSAQSTKGKGSRFAVSLPWGREHLLDEQVEETHHEYLSEEEFIFASDDLTLEPEARSEELAAASQQILVVEDNDDLQSFLKKKLGGTYQVVPATDGNDGLQKAFELTPDLIICDIMLPGMDGLAITRTLKKDLRTSHIPIILLSARSMVEQQIEGAEAGADSYVTKPFNIRFLEAKIKSLLLNRQVLRENYSRGLMSFSPVSVESTLPESINKLDAGFLESFTSYIEQHHARQDFQVSDLCREFGLSRSQLYRKVSALLGESISDHIQNVRLKKAEELLLAGKLSIAEIAYQVGYSSPDYFSTVFRSRYGVAPSSFRKQN